jgi:hypothetical protein
MWLTLLAVAVGLVAGVVAGGKLRALGAVKPVGIALAAVWLLLTALTRWAAVPQARLLFFIANICALAFAALNGRRLGSWLLLAGLTLNTLVIGLNGAMPYRVSSVIGADLATIASDFPSTVQTRPERDGDRLTFLGDVLAVKAGFIQDVFSVGDALAALGLGWIVYSATTRKSKQEPAASHANLTNQNTSTRKAPARKSGIKLGEAHDLDDLDDSEQLQKAQQLQKAKQLEQTKQPDDATVTRSATSLVVDLTIDRANHPERYEQATSGLLEPFLDAQDEELLDITSGDMPGGTFWHERSVQRNRVSRS